MFLLIKNSMIKNINNIKNLKNLRKYLFIIINYNVIIKISSKVNRPSVHCLRHIRLNFMLNTY